MATTADILATAQQLRAGFADFGAAVVEADILQPAAILLDLYGEDIRSRAYVTNDPLQGEMMLRPDFTVPVVQMHMASHADPARYTYAGKVFRKQSFETARPSEYVQVGFEVFDGSNSAVADAEVFAAIATASAIVHPSVRRNVSSVVGFVSKALVRDSALYDEKCM